MQTAEVNAAQAIGTDDSIKASALERRIEMSLGRAQIEQGVEQRLKRLSRTAKMPGFRPGKVPLKVLAQSYGGSARIEAIEDLLSKMFDEKVREQNLRVAGRPRIEPKGDMAEGSEELVFDAIFEVFPEIVIGALNSQEVDRPVLEVNEEDVDRTIETLRQQRKTYSDTDRAAQKDDQVTIDFVGRKDGVEFEGGSAQDFSVVVGSGSMIEDFDAALLGVRTGDQKTFDVKFPDDYQAKELAGQVAQFDIKVKKVEAPQLPEVDAEFARQVGIEDGDVTKMREEIKTNLQGEVKRRLLARTKDSVMKAILAVTPVDAPRALVELEAQQLAENARQTVFARMPNAKNMPIQPAWFIDEATRRVKLGLIMAEIVKTNALQAKPDQVKAKVEELAAHYEDPSEVIRFYHSQPQRLAQIEQLVTEENVVEWALQQAKVNSKPIAFNELMETQA